MNTANKNNDINLNLTCPICGENMIEDVFAYDNNVNGKMYYKCLCCGHKYSKII